VEHNEDGAKSEKEDGRGRAQATSVKCSPSTGNAVCSAAGVISRVVVEDKT